MRRPVSARSVCSSGLSPTTVIDSSMAPISIFKSTRTVALTGTSTPSRTVFLNPVSSPTTRYVPSFRLEDVVPVLVRRRVVTDVGVDLGDRDGRAGNGEAGGVADVADERSFDRLRPKRSGNEHGDDEDNQGPTHRSLLMTDKKGRPKGLRYIAA